MQVVLCLNVLVLMKLKCKVGKQELHLASFIDLCFVYAREQFCLQENLELSSILYSVTQ